MRACRGSASDGGEEGGSPSPEDGGGFGFRRAAMSAARGSSPEGGSTEEGEGGGETGAVGDRIEARSARRGLIDAGSEGGGEAGGSVKNGVEIGVSSMIVSGLRLTRDAISAARELEGTVAEGSS
jgi:hypothetical protein